ncbi:DUF1402 family protein [soil metagenome]
MRSLLSLLSLLSLSLVSHGANAAPQDPNPFVRFDREAVAQATALSAQGRLFVVPRGNGDVIQIPEFPGRTLARLGLALEGLPRTAEARTALAKSLGPRKIPEIMKALDAEGLIKEAVRVSKRFKIDPVHILGPIVGENTFNGFIDRTIQNHYHQMFAKSDIETMSQKMSQLTQAASGYGCFEAQISNYWKWRCLLFYSTIDNSNGGMMNDGFYSIKGSGTFGIAQMQPFLLWSLNDIVVQTMGYRKFEVTDLESPMQIIFKNKEMLAYLAANAAVSIEVYKMVAGVDISNNPGITTTLYNVGDEYRRAYSFNQLRARGSGVEAPKVNYLGWYVNQFEGEIRSYLKKYQ